MVGFDDQPYSAVLTPPLTTVRQPIYEQAVKALETIIAIIDGKQVPENIILPTKAVIRQSCGCGETEPISINTLLHYKEKSTAHKQKNNRDKSVILSSIQKDLGDLLADNFGLTITDIEELLDTLLLDIENTRDQTFLKLLIYNVNYLAWPDPMIGEQRPKYISNLQGLYAKPLSTCRQLH